MSRANREASRMALSSSHLDGYSGPLDVVVLEPRRFWKHRVLRRRRKSVVGTTIYGDIRGDSARAWEYRRAKPTN